MNVFEIFSFLFGKIVDFLSIPIPLGNDIEVSLFSISIATALAGILFAVVRHFFKGD